MPEEVGLIKTRAELGLEMVLAAKNRGVPFGWVGMDCHYGQQPWLLSALEEEEIVYIADIPCDTRVWLGRKKPKTGVPPRKKGRGRPPTKERVLKGEKTPVEVRKIVEKLAPSQWCRVLLRDTERKKLWSRLASLRVYPVREGLPGRKEQRWLIIRKDEGTNRVKYQLSNAPPNTPVERLGLGEMSCSRYWMERALQDAKGEAGLEDYQVRTWLGWHHHMTMTLIALLFILELQIEWGERARKLSVQDVREVLEVILPKNEITPGEILEIIKQKHKARESARKSHHKRKRKKQM